MELVYHFKRINILILIPQPIPITLLGTSQYTHAGNGGEAREEYNAPDQLTDDGERVKASEEKENCSGKKYIGEKRQHSENFAASTGEQGTNGGEHCNGRKYRGVTRQPSGRFAAAITENRTRMQLGTFETEEEAALAYDSSALRLHGSSAVLNFPRRSSGDQNTGLSGIELWKKATSYLNSQK